jgi:hypothetical protein
MDQLVNAVTGLGPPRKAVLLKITREIPRGVYSRRNRFVWRPSPSGLNNNITNSFVPTEDQMLQFHAMMQAQSTSGFSRRLNAKFFRARANARRRYDVL